MTDQNLKEIENTNVGKDLIDLIVNRWGINLVSVDSIDVESQEDGQLKSIRIKFIPSEEEQVDA